MTSSDSNTSLCPLCGTHGSPHHRESSGRLYLRCSGCDMIWLSAEHRLTPKAELGHYLTHENDPADPHYRNFLNQLWRPMRARLTRGSRGLDYGSGPGPTLHLMASEDGCPCHPYDPFFDPHPERLDQTYDFVTCSETAEHFFEPATEFARLSQLVRPSGWLGVMTLRVPDPVEFGRWHYRLDPTHVCFYQDATFEWIAREFGFQHPEFISNRIVLLQKR